MDIVRLLVIAIVGAVGASVITPLLKKLAELSYRIDNKTIRGSKTQRDLRDKKRHLLFCLILRGLGLSTAFYFLFNPKTVIWDLVSFAIGLIGTYLPNFFKQRGIWERFLCSVCFICIYGAGFFLFNFWWSDVLGRGEYNLGLLGVYISLSLTGIGYLIAKFLDRDRRTRFLR